MATIRTPTLNFLVGWALNAGRDVPGYTPANQGKEALIAEAYDLQPPESTAVGVDEVLYEFLLNVWNETP